MHTEHQSLAEPAHYCDRNSELTTIQIWQGGCQQRDFTFITQNGRGKPILCHYVFVSPHDKQAVTPAARCLCQSCTKAEQRQLPGGFNSLNASFQRGAAFISPGWHPHPKPSTSGRAGGQESSRGHIDTIVDPGNRISLETFKPLRHAVLWMPLKEDVGTGRK